jgi:hypothetical protein
MSQKPMRRILGRIAMAVLSAAALLGAPSAALAQDPPPAAPAQTDQFVFTHDSIMMGFTIDANGTAEFESLVARVKEALQKSSKAERKQQAEHWKLIKLETPPQGGNVTYFLVVEKVVKGTSYDMFKILSEELPPADVQEIYEKVKPIFKAGISFTPIKIAG